MDYVVLTFVAALAIVLSYVFDNNSTDSIEFEFGGGGFKFILVFTRIIAGIIILGCVAGMLFDNTL